MKNWDWTKANFGLIVSDAIFGAGVTQSSIKQYYHSGSVNMVESFIDGHRYVILSNKISKNTFISSEISKSKYGAMYSSMRTFTSENVVEEVDEKVYSSKYIFDKDL